MVKDSDPDDDAFKEELKANYFKEKAAHRQELQRTLVPQVGAGGFLKAEAEAKA